MTLKRVLIPVGALAVVLGAGVFSADAAQDRDRDRHGDRDRSSQVRTRRDDGRQHGAEARPAQRDGREQHGEARGPRAEVRERQRDERVFRDDRSRRDDRVWRDDRGRRDDRVWRNERHDGAVYGPPRIVSPRFGFPGRSPYRHYGPGPGLSVYFGRGSGYLYGAPYSGRVYGYSVPGQGYGVRRYYGDVRLEIRPRDAAVYVDGYYAGVVDDFDGVFQRLTLEAGPHRIEVELPGFETRAFDVSVDPTRTVDLRDELLPERP
jgi:hypothetical protein